MRCDGVCRRRYASFRAKVGRAYWLASLVSFHLTPSLLVFFALGPVFAPLADGASSPLNAGEMTAAGLTLAAIAVESVADEQLRLVRASDAVLAHLAVCER